MATLDDKLLGEKLHYYCSSSEDEGEDDDEAKEEGGEAGASASAASAKPKFIPESEIKEWQGTAANTGPKGVIADWRRFKQLERENREEQEAERAKLAKKLSMTCRTDKEDLEAKEQEEKADQDLENLLDDDFLRSYMERRMREMAMAAGAASSNLKFGHVLHLNDGDEFLQAIDHQDHKSVTVIVLIYEPTAPGCEAINGCLKVLSAEHPYAKFCRILASAAGLSKHFKASGVPALLVYKGGEMMTSFVRLTDALGEDFYANDLESYLVEHAVLRDPSTKPPTGKIRGPAIQEEDDDDD